MKQYIRAYIHSSLLLCAILTSGCLDMGGNGRALSKIVKSASDSLGSPATDQTKMWVKAKAGTKELKIHKISNPSTSLTDPTDYNLPCEITVSGSPQDFTCIAEVEELDLFYNGIDIAYNIPGTVCNYTRISPYWYFRYQVGRGAAYVVQTYPLSGPATIQYGDDATSALAAAPASAADPYSNMQCPFNYANFGGPNCCLGTYTLSTRQETTAGQYNTQNTLGNWGGDAGKCVDGPGADTTNYKRDPVFRTPMPNYLNIEGSGISGNVTSASSYKRLYKTNIYNANFFNPADHGGAGNVPEPLKSIIFTDPSEFSATPSYAYEFQCLDRASLVKHRIQLYVREWNEALQLQLFSQGQNGTSSDTTNGTATTPETLNDFRDWKDMSPTASGGFPKNKQ